MWQNKKVSVVFPAYNEEENIKNAISNFLETGIVDELIVVDNNSTDRTSQFAVKAGVTRVVKEKKQGYGFALRCGMGKATGNYVILAEPDGTFDSRDIIKLLKKAKNFDLVLGSRTNSKFIRKGANMGPLLKNGNIVMAKLLQILFRTPSLTDCGCTLRLVNKNLLKKILPQMTVGGGHFLPEMVILSHLNGAKITEIPVIYRPRVGSSKITGSLRRTISVGLTMFALILSYRFKNI